MGLIPLALRPMFIRRAVFGRLLVAATLAFGAHTAVLAQQQPAAAASSAAAGTADATDPVSRFLSERGLINTRPVVEAAQQVKDKAANLASELVLSAMNFLGVPYRMGGNSKEGGFDCSGFTRHVFENSLGLILPRRAAEQANMPGMLQVNQAELKPGDLVFFNTLRHTFSHVGIHRRQQVHPFTPCRRCGARGRHAAGLLATALRWGSPTARIVKEQHDAAVIGHHRAQRPARAS